MRSEEVFDICLERFRGLRGWLDGRIRAVDMTVPGASGYQWRPERARAQEYVADFEIAGLRALARPVWAGRRRMFSVYYLHGIEYRRAIAMLGVPTGTFDYWSAQIKRTVGREFERAGIFPAVALFQFAFVAGIWEFAVHQSSQVARLSLCRWRRLSENECYERKDGTFCPLTNG